MRNFRHRRFALAPALGLMAGSLFLGGCPAEGTCPTCRYRTASFTVSAADLDGMTSVSMHTHIENPSTECPKSGCIYDHTDDITCKVGTAAGTKRQKLPAMSADGATHDVTITIQAGETTKPAITATVGTPADTTPPGSPICP
jgi:hypothetical protein